MSDQLQYPDQSYYPSVKVRLIIRFDEFANTKTVSGKAPKKIVTKLRGIKDKRSTVEAVLDANSPPGISRYILLPTDGDAPGGPQKVEGSADQLTHVVGGIIPSTCDVQLNGLRTADTAKLELRYLDLPVDPRIVRSCAIEIYAGAVSAEDFSNGVNGGIRGSTGSTSDGEPLNVVPDTWTDANGKQRSNLRFSGFVDEWEVEFSNDKEPSVRFTCRDNTQLLLDTPAPPGLVLDLKAPIDKAIATYLSNFPTFAGLTVEYRPGGVAIPTLEGKLSKGAYNPKTGGPAPSKGGGTSKLSTWDYLTDIVGMMGHTIRVEGSSVIVQQPRTIYGDSFLTRDDDPFKGRTLPTGETLKTRLFVYGRNLSSLKMGRKFGNGQPKNIEVISYNTGNKTPLVVRFPEPTDPLITKANPGDGHSEVNYQIVRVHGITDKGTLKLIAQSTFEQLGRNEINVHMQTKNLASFGGGNPDPDILDMIAGDTVDVQIHREDDGQSSAGIIDAIFASQERTRDFLTTIGYSVEFATAAARASNDSGFQTRFKVRALQITWKIEEGITLDINAVNYVQVRVDPKWQGQEPDKGTSASGQTQDQGRASNG